MNEIQWTPSPDDWFAATIYYTNEKLWAFARLDNGLEVFIPAPVRAGTISEELAVRLKPNTRGPGKRIEATEAVDLEEYLKLLAKAEENL
jgi:hypothetical protein